MELHLGVVNVPTFRRTGADFPVDHCFRGKRLSQWKNRKWTKSETNAENFHSSGWQFVRDSMITKLPASSSLLRLDQTGLSAYLRHVNRKEFWERQRIILLPGPNAQRIIIPHDRRSTNVRETALHQSIRYHRVWWRIGRFVERRLGMWWFPPVHSFFWQI